MGTLEVAQTSSDTLKGSGCSVFPSPSQSSSWPTFNWAAVVSADNVGCIVADVSGALYLEQNPRVWVAEKGEGGGPCFHTVVGCVCPLHSLVHSPCLALPDMASPRRACPVGPLLTILM